MTDGRVTRVTAEQFIDTMLALIVESGGLHGEVLRQLAAADLPALTHLELWLGDDAYGWDGAVGDVEPFLTAARLTVRTRQKNAGFRPGAMHDPKEWRTNRGDIDHETMDDCLDRRVLDVR